MLQAKTPIAIALACVLGTGAAAALAAPPGGHPLAADRVDMRLERMSGQLDLTEAQQAEIRALIDAHHDAADLDRAALREQIDAVLTDEQRALRDDRMQSRMEQRLERMADRLDLTDAQRAEVQAIMDEQRANPALSRTELRERMAAVLTDEQREQLGRMRGRDGRGMGRDGDRW
jgi:Spy/CpxP family protein refolding chaperone